MNPTEGAEYSLLAKLQTTLALNKARILADPLPYIERQHREIVKLQAFVHDVEMALMPDVVFDAAMSMNIDPNRFNGADRIKLNAVQTAINKYRSK